MNKLCLFAAILLTTLCADAAEQERSARERYFNATVIPGIDRLQENALAAVRAADPKQLGNALLMLVLARDELSPTLTEERRDFLRNIAIALNLATEDEFRQFHAFLARSKNQRWIPETRAALIRFEQHIADADPRGAWLPVWVDGIPLLPAAAPDTGSIPPSWTWRGHAVAQELAEAAAAPPHWRDSVLAEYRKNALAAWRGAASTLWEGIPTSLPDADIPVRLRRIAEGDDPASRFAALAAEHLLPMFDPMLDKDAPPEILWLRIHRKTPGKPPPAAASATAIAEAARVATDRTAALNAAAGANVWPTLSPLATDVYARHLLARQTALELDAAWRRTVYTPSRFSPGNPGQSRDRLVAFLTGPADGVWMWREDGAIDNARRHGVPFTLSREFLNYCNAALAAARSPAMAEIPLAFTVDSVTITGRNVIERPIAARFRLGTGGSAQTLAYNNYPASADWTWTPGIGEAEIRITFPSHTAAIRFATSAERRRFYTLFGEGRCVLTPDDFGPDSAPVLRRLGVEEIAIAATLANLEKLLPQLNREPLPPLPMRIIIPKP